VDQSKSYKFRFRELNNLKDYLGGDIAIVEKSGTLKLIDVTDLAAELGIKEAHIWYLIKTRVIEPFIRVHSKTSGSRPLFRRGDIRRIKEKLANRFYSATDAARVLSEDLKTFKNKWVDTQKLKPVRTNIGIEKMYFRKGDVIKLKNLKKACVTGPTAAKMIGVHRTKILKWTVMGRLQAVSGPSIDGFGCYLYLKEDVRNFRDKRKEASYANRKTKPRRR
jgi:hypothetical protein